jgi:hypothetical protein
MFQIDLCKRGFWVDNVLQLDVLNVYKRYRSIIIIQVLYETSEISLKITTVAIVRNFEVTCDKFQGSVLLEIMRRNRYLVCVIFTLKHASM